MPLFWTENGKWVSEKFTGPGDMKQDIVLIRGRRSNLWCITLISRQASEMAATSVSKVKVNRRRGALTPITSSHSLCHCAVLV